jgi:hypothetical protein
LRCAGYVNQWGIDKMAAGPTYRAYQQDPEAVRRVEGSDARDCQAPLAMLGLNHALDGSSLCGLRESDRPRRGNVDRVRSIWNVSGPRVSSRVGPRRMRRDPEDGSTDMASAPRTARVNGFQQQRSGGTFRR